MRDDELLSRLPWLSVSGDRIVDDTGRTVRLTGVGLGELQMSNIVALDDTARDYSAEEQQKLAQLRSDVEALVRENPDALR